jgi:hypothetical protein
MGPLFFLPLADASERKKVRSPRWRCGDGEDLGAKVAVVFSC